MTDLIARLLDVLEGDIVPLTREGVRAGNKIFGAAILRKSDWSLIVASTNAETESPLWHGEIATIKKLYELPKESRPAPQDCLFLSTHEPCPMCLSAITWAGFDNFYYLFSYQQTRDAFQIPHDLRILKEVFGREDYVRENAYWKAHDILKMCQDSPPLLERVERLRKVYDELSGTYQASKGTKGIPLE